MIQQTTSVTRESSQRLIAQRRTHPAWLLLASRNGPLMIACLRLLIDAHPEGIEFEDATETLAQLFADFGNDPQFDFGEDLASAARRELRQWLKKGLIVERAGHVFATDALQRALRFVDALEDDTMTSTASRLATVQRAIEALEAQLTHSQETRSAALKARIKALQDELSDVESGNFEVLSGRQAEEAIREVYQLAVSLRADFRRVEDSYREADRSLRQRIIGQQQNRGDVVDELLDGHQALLQTNEGQVFDNFYQQLVKSAELELMKQRLRSVLESESCQKALLRKQKSDLRLLVSRLVRESERVIQARARSERDVRGFLKSGLADEQLRVGALLQEIFRVAMEVDWSSHKVRRLPGPLPPTAVASSNLPVIERLLVKQVDADSDQQLDFTITEAAPENLEEEFWNAWQVLDRIELFESTIAHLKACGKPLTLGELAAALPPTQDLETLVFWLAMAREAGVEIGDDRETIDLHDDVDDEITRFDTPLVKLDATSTEDLEPGNLE